MVLMKGPNIFSLRNMKKQTNEFSQDPTLSGALLSCTVHVKVTDFESCVLTLKI